MRWEQLQNGALLAAASEAGFDRFLTIDKHLEHQQNLAALALPVVVLDGESNALPALLPLAPFIRNLLATPLERVLYIVQESGHVLRLKAPRNR